MSISINIINNLTNLNLQDSTAIGLLEIIVILFILFAIIYTIYKFLDQ